MTAASELLRRAEEVVLSVVDLPGPDRLRAAARICRGEPALAAEVSSLLRHSDAAGRFLEEPALGTDFVLLPAEAAGAQARDPLIGRLIGRYRIERRIASGGMGTVYLATRADEAFAQRVALKIVKRGMDSEEILARFRRERQTLAALEHPHIARLIDGGATDDGQPYLAMEYVEGEPIDAYCDSRRLDVTARLRLMLAVCDGVRYAHQKLVVHRDLKPGNILVTAEGIPKLLDFGIATVLDAAGPRSVTAARDRRLTPEYASPEQIAGAPAATSSDVYSLGVILYELLTGSPPYRFATRTPADIERVVTGTAPLRPSEILRQSDAPPDAPSARGATRDRLASRLRGDLDTIVLAALRKEPDRRYASVEQFATDLRRHLDGLPVSARRDTFAYRTSRFVRRHALACALACACVLALAGGVVAFAWQARAAGRERDEAVVARNQAQAITSFLQDMLASADPSRLGREVSVHEVLDVASGRLDGDLADQPRVRASLRATVGKTYHALGLYDDAERQLREAKDERIALLGPHHPDVAASLVDLASLLFDRRNLDEAATLLADAADITRDGGADQAPELATVLSSLGAVRRAQGRLDESERLHREALAMREQPQGEDSLDVAESLNNLSVLRDCQGDLPAAQELQGRALGIRRRILGPSHPLVAQSTDNLALITLRRGDLDAAEPLFREALATEVELLGDDHPDVAVTRRNLARLLLQRAEADEAEALLRRCVQVREQILDATDLRLISARLDFMDALQALGRHDEAMEQAGIVVAAAEAVSTESGDRPAILQALMIFFGRTGEAERAAAIRAELLPP